MSKLVRRTDTHEKRTKMLQIQTSLVGSTRTAQFFARSAESTAAPALPIGQITYDQSMYDQSPIDGPSDIAQDGRF